MLRASLRTFFAVAVTANLFAVGVAANFFVVAACYCEFFAVDVVANFFVVVVTVTFSLWLSLLDCCYLRWLRSVENMSIEL